MNLNLWTPKSSPMLRHRNGRKLSPFLGGVDDLVDRFWGRDSLDFPQLFDTNFYPAIDMQEKDDKYLLEADLPGMNEKDIEIDVHNNTLTIKGEKKMESKDQDGEILRFERTFGSFRRDVSFDSEVNPEKISAELKDGVLRVELMKMEKGTSSRRKIKIKH